MQNRLHVKTGGDFQYDSAGNMTCDVNGLYYGYDAENRITTAGNDTYTYDAEGNRVKKANGASGTLYWHTTAGVLACDQAFLGNFTAQIARGSSKQITICRSLFGSNPLFECVQRPLGLKDCRKLFAEPSGSSRSASVAASWR